jgi:hypothetical protein
MQAEAAQKIDELITRVELNQLNPICTRNWSENKHTPIYGLIKRKTPKGGGVSVGGTGLEPATSSV